MCIYTTLIRTNGWSNFAMISKNLACSQTGNQFLLPAIHHLIVSVIVRYRIPFCWLIPLLSNLLHDQLQFLHLVALLLRNRLMWIETKNESHSCVPSVINRVSPAVLSFLLYRHSLLINQLQKSLAMVGPLSTAHWQSPTCAHYALSCC